MEPTAVIPAELNIFSQAKIQGAVLGHSIVPLKPVNAVTLPLSTLEFHSSGSNDFYRDLSQTYLRLRVCLRGEDGSIPDVEEDVACVNLLLHSLFQTFELFFNEQCVSRIDHYGYKSYIETLLNYSSEAANTHLTTSMFYLDTPNAVDTPGPANTGFTKRRDLLSLGKSCELFGRLRCGLFDQPLLLPQGLDMRIKMTFAPENFYMWAAEGAARLKLHVTDATLYCKSVNVSPSLLLSHARVLAQARATYPFKFIETKAFTSAPGARNITLNSVCSGRLPSFICLAMLDNASFNGAIQKNSFSFKHKSVTSVSIFVNNYEHKIGPIDFHSNQPNFAYAYHSLFSSTGADSRPAPHMITPEMFTRGSFLVCKDLSLDSSGHTTHTSIPLNGELRVEVTFATPLDAALTILVLLEHDRVMEIDASRSILIS